MRLKALEIQGFKSFPDKTKISFNQGMTAVVGPNGSGKSNISDAMRWVMGEQSTKTLRGGKMEDVIFAGTAKRKPQGAATVSLSFDNSGRELSVENDEVTITRKYYRSGDSEYLINGEQVRLKDVNELFMDTGLGKDGYSMIGQGKIAEIVGAKSKERREIFEEAAGISKYRYRKAEAERKLEQAQENLLRLYDILGELEGRVEPLRIQSEKAAQFIELADRKKSLEVSLWLKTLDKYKAALKAQENKYLIAKGDEERLALEIERIEEKISGAYEQMKDCLVKSEEYQNIKSNLQNRIGELKSEIAVKQNDILHNEEHIARVEEELKRQQESDAEAEAEIAAKEAQLLKIKADLDALFIEREEKQQELQSLTQQGDEFDSRLQALNAEGNQIVLDLSRYNMTVLNLENLSADEQQRLHNAQQEASTLEAQLQSEQETMTELKGLLEEIKGKKDGLSNALSGLTMKLKSRQEKYEASRQEYAALDLSVKEKLQKAKLLTDLEQNLEGFAFSVKTVMKSAKDGALRGVHGTVAQLVNVKKEYSVAVETALGGALQQVIVEDESAAKAAIRLLSERKAGRATFLPLTSVKGNLLDVQGLSNYGGYVALASELVSYDDKYAGIVRSLLGRIAVVDDLDTAIAISKKYGYKFRIVTLDGQQVNAGGSFTGGSAAKNQGILSRKNEAEQLKVEAGRLNEQKTLMEQKLREMSEQIRSLQAQIEGTNSEMIVANEDQLRFSGDLQRYEQSRVQLLGRQEQLSAQTAESRRRIDESAAGIADAKEQIEALLKRQAALKEELSGFEGSQGDLTLKRQELSEALNQLAHREIEWQKDMEAISAATHELRSRKQKSEVEKAALLAQKEGYITVVEELKQSIAAREKDGETFASQILEYDQKIKAVLEKRQQIEGETTKFRAEEREVSAKKEAAAGELARLEEQKLSAQKDYDTIIARLWEDYELTRSEASAIAVGIEDQNAAQKELNSIKNKIKALGTVNLSAIEEYKEVSERYEFLKEQVGDASRSKDELTRLIAALTKEMETIFSENFQKINENFSRIFVELFGGGKASLTLNDPDDILNSGIEINVQPPGKIIKNLASLSGGEQSFVAIAIYFAILKVRPSPFCVLDEIEAALDDVNVNKYASYLRMLSDKTQFIMITHRRGTMEEADVLYGVTMQEEGVSKLLELKVSEIEGKLGGEKGA